MFALRQLTKKSFVHQKKKKRHSLRHWQEKACNEANRNIVVKVLSVWPQQDSYRQLKIAKNKAGKMVKICLQSNCLKYLHEKKKHLNSLENFKYKTVPVWGVELK